MPIREETVSEDTIANDDGTTTTIAITGYFVDFEDINRDDSQNQLLENIDLSKTTIDYDSSLSCSANQAM